jgi:hypothetical protein
MTQLVAAPTTPESPAAGRDETREMAAATVVGIGAVAAFSGLVLPNSAANVALATAAPIGQFPNVLVLGGVLAAGMMIGGFAWALAVERRKPWPFGDGPARRSPKLDVFVGLVGMMVATVAATLYWPARGLFDTADPAIAMTVSLPANLGRTLIAGILGYWVAPALLRLARGIVDQVFEPAESPATAASQT